MLFLTKILVKTSEIKNKMSQPWKIFTYIHMYNNINKEPTNSRTEPCGKQRQKTKVHYGAKNQFEIAFEL